MKRSTCITVGLVTAVLVFLCLAGLAITLGLVFGLGIKNHTDSIETTPEQKTDSIETTPEQETTTPIAATTTEQATTTLTVDEEIMRIFTNNVVFPNGSYIISLSNLSTDASAQAPAIVNNISVLTQIEVNADSTNDVIVSGRQTFLYIAAPNQQSSTTNRKRRAAPYIGLCVQFSTSNDCHMVPYDLKDSGLGFLPLVKKLNDQIVYQLPIAAPSFLCQSSSGSRCVPVTYQTYAISRDFRSPASEPASLSVACGSQCQGQQGTCKQSCQACNSEIVSGTDTPVSRRYHMQNQTSGSFPFFYETYSVRDRMRIYQDDVQIFDSGCVGTDGKRNIIVPFSGTSDEIRVDVEPNCLGTRGTGWYFDVRCPLTS